MKLLKSIWRDTKWFTVESYKYVGSLPQFIIGFPRAYWIFMRLTYAGRTV